jgi:hypothetical protein
LVNGAGGFDVGGIERVVRVTEGVDGLYEVGSVGFVGSSTEALGKGGASKGVGGWFWKWVFGGHKGGKARDDVSVHKAVTNLSQLLRPLVLYSLEAGDKPFEGINALCPVAESIDVRGKVVIAKLEEGAIDFEAKGRSGDGMREVVGKGAEDRWVVERASKSRDGYAIAFLGSIKAMVTRGAVWGAAKRTEHVKDNILGKSMEGGFALSISGMIKYACSAEISGF